MTIRVQTEDGAVVEFPDGTPPGQIESVMRQYDADRQARQAYLDQQRPGAQIGAAAGAFANNPRPLYPGWRARGVEDLIRGSPSQGYRRAYDQRRAYREAVPRDWTTQMVGHLGVQDELAGAGAWLTQGGENLVRRATGQPIEIPQREAVNAAIDFARQEQGDFAREHPAQNVGAMIASVPAAAGRPATLPANMNPFGVGAAAAGVNAPFALARQEGSFQERAPGAAVETAAVGAFGTGLQSLANRLARPALANTAAARTQQFDRAGVRAPLAAVQGRGSAPIATAIAANPIGGNVRRHLANTADDVATAARGMAARAGVVEPRETAGEQVQRAVRRFAQDRNAPQPQPGDPRRVPVAQWTFPAKARALYDDVFGRLARDEQAMLQGQVQGPLLSTRATNTTLQEIMTRVSGPASREAMASPMITKMAQALRSDRAAGQLRFQDLRAWRTWVREAQRNEGLRQGLDNAALQRLERALTEDIYTSAMMIGGSAADDLRLVDRWYRTVTNRIKAALDPFTADGVGGVQAYRRIIQLAQQGGRQNTRQLTQLRQSLPPDVWRTQAATILDELGHPSFGAPNVLEPGAFSIEHFVTNYARLSPEGRRALFGALADDLDNLAQVAGYVKGVRGFTNYSRSGTEIQNISTITGVGMAATAAVMGDLTPLALLAGAGLTARITGEMLTNPGFVRWLTQSGAAGGGMRRHLAGLATLAARDPALAPLYRDLAEHAAGRVQPEGTNSRVPTEQQPERIEAVP